MNKVKLSKAAEDALLAADSNRQGARVKADLQIEWELLDAELIGKGGGLTRRGTIARQRVLDTRLNEAFG